MIYLDYSANTPVSPRVLQSFTDAAARYVGNPNSNLVDVEAVAAIAHENKIPLVVDSTFTPANVIRPIEHGADIVIHYDPWWNAAAQNQATDRAHRIGQKHTVTVYKLIASSHP